MSNDYVNQENANRVSSIIENEAKLEQIIHDLIAQSVNRHDISVQGSPTQFAEKYGVAYLKPHIIQKEASEAPKTEPFLQDDFGWLMGFSFSIPLFICIVLGIFVIGDIQSATDIILYGFLGAVVGSILGYLLFSFVKTNRAKKVKKQEQQGGFVLWVATHSEAQLKEVMTLLKNYQAKNIAVEKTSNE